MATVSKLSILVDANATGVTKGLAPVVGHLKQFQDAATGAFHNATESAAKLVLSYLAVQKIVARIKHAFSELKTLGPLLKPSELSAVIAVRDAWNGINQEIDLAILRTGAELAPTILTILENTRALLDPLTAANDFIKSIGEGARWIGAQWANLQGIVSGAILMWVQASDLFFGQWLNKLELVKGLIEKVSGKDLFKNDAGLDKAAQEIKTLLETFHDGHKMFQAGISGQAGRDFLKQVEEQKAAITNITPFHVKPEVKDIISRIEALQPAGLALGSAGAMSAVNQARRDTDGSKKVLLDQLKELRRIARQRPVVLAPANI